MDGKEDQIITGHKEGSKRLTQKQVELIGDTFDNDLSVRLYGGYAEEALLEGRIT